MKKIRCGQVWKIKKKNNYNVGSLGDYFIVLSLDDFFWLIGCFWIIDGKWGGARGRELGEKEINEIGEYIGELKELILKKGE